MVFEDQARISRAHLAYREARSSSIFRDAVSTLRSAMLPCDPFVRPSFKSFSFEQRSIPTDSTRVVADQSSISAHVSLACAASMPSADPARFATPDLRAAVSFVSSHDGSPAQLLHWRSSQQLLLTRVKRSLQPLSDSLRPWSPRHIRSLPCQHDSLLIDALSLASGLPDAEIGFNTLVGFCTVGNVPDTGLFRPCPRVASVDFSTFDHAAWADRIHSKVRSRGLRMTERQRADAATVFDKTVSEVEGGWSAGPFTRAEIRRRFPGGYWPTRRFGVEQKGSVRPCDDGRESDQNSATSEHETITNSSAELPSAIASLFYSALGPRCRLRGGSDDWRKAYRQCGARDLACQVVVLWDPSTSDVRYFIIYGHEFGQLAAVNNFNWVAAVACRSARLLFACCAGNYFDDYAVVEPLFARSSGQCSLLHLHRSCGFLLDRDKHERMAACFRFLGVMHDLSRSHEGKVTLRIVQERADRVSAVCSSVLSSRRLHAGQSARLRGKLFFACTTAFGKLGRAALQPLVSRQFGKSRSSALTDDEAAALSFFVALLHDMPPRVVDLCPSADDPAVLWSDASYEGGVGEIGFVLFEPRLVGVPCSSLPEPLTRADDPSPFSGFVFSSSVLPSPLHALLVPKAQQVGQCEIIGGLTPYLTLPSILRGRDVMHWIDNTSAASVLLHGYSGKPDSARLANIFHMFNAGLRARIYFEYVESKANVADLPSRGDFDYLRSLRALRVPMRFPLSSEWHAPLRHWISLAAPSAGRKRGRSRVPGRRRKHRRLGVASDT